MEKEEAKHLTASRKFTMHAKLRIVTEKFQLLQDCVTKTGQPVVIHVLP